MSVEHHGPYIPSAVQRDRVLHSLQTYYPQRTPDECRTTLARMYGHEDWAGLESAMLSAQSPSLFDEHVAPQTVGARFQQQYDALLAGLVGITDDIMMAAQALDQQLFSLDRESIGKRYDPQYYEKRIERARCAWHLLYARHAILETRPTAEAAAVIAPDREDIDFSFRIDLLPRALESWLAHHRPLLRRWAERLAELDVRQHAATDLLRFSYCWGQACLECAVEIPKSLQLYPVVLGAKWFAWVTTARMPRLQPAYALLHSEAVTDEERKRAHRAISDAMDEEEARFILAQPREDFRSHSASAREQHIHAGYALLRKWIGEAATRCTVRDIMSRSVWSALSPAMRGG